MGWWWNSANPQPTGAPPSKPEESALPQQLSSTVPGSQPPPAQSQTRQLSRDEQSEQELAAWLREIQAETSGTTATKSQAQYSITSPSPPDIDISPDTLYPTEISCRSSFDYAFFCSSFGGQFVNVYRYGGFRSCSNHWDDFWLCMRTRNWDQKDRKKAIQDHYRKKAVKYKTGPSSEDVWEVRMEPVKDAFQGNLEELERQVEVWKKANPGVKEPWEGVV